MKKSYLTNIALLLLILGLYWFINREPSVIESEHISSLSAEHAHTIKIQRRDRNDIVLQKQGEQWFIQQPIQANANAIRVNLILDLLSSVSHNQIAVRPDLSLQQFALDPAQFTLLINDQKFEFGAIETLNKYRYIRHNNIVHLINDTVAPLLNANAASFINNRLFTDGLHISKISLPDINDKNTLISALTISLENGHWKSSNATLATDKITSIVNAWQHAYAMQVKPLSQEKINQAIGQKVTFEFTNQSTIELLLQFDDRSMSLIDFNTQLKYLFPLSIKQQFFPSQDSAQ